MRRPHDKNRNREVGRDFSPMELALLEEATSIMLVAQRTACDPEDANFLLELERTIVLRQFAFANGPSGLFPEAETAGKIGS